MRRAPTIHPPLRAIALVTLTVLGCHKPSGGAALDAGGASDAVADAPPFDAAAVPALLSPPDGAAPKGKGCSDDGWCEVMKVKKGSLVALWGVNPHNVYAVWSGLLVHETDGDWSAVPCPAKGILAITGIWPTDVWLVGQEGAIWHGPRGWKPMPSGTKNDLLGVAAHATDDVWIVGRGGTLLHYGGTEWKSVASGTTADLFGVWAHTSGEAWAVGAGGTALHGFKGAWTAVPTPTKQPLGAVWGSETNDVWAVGGHGTVLHWDGNAWSAAAAPPAPDLFSIWGANANDVWAVGAEGAILRFDGTWSRSPSGVDDELHGVWGSDDRNVMAVGFSPKTGDSSTLRRHR